MSDQDNNGIDDDLEAAVQQIQGSNGFSWRSLFKSITTRDVLAGLIAIALVSLFLVVGRAAAPEWAQEPIKAFGEWFAGSTCSDIEAQRDSYKSAWDCIEGGAAATGTDISTCADKLQPKE